MDNQWNQAYVGVENLNSTYSKTIQSLCIEHGKYDRETIDI
jgi:hypothetical protein